MMSLGAIPPRGARDERAPRARLLRGRDLPAASRVQEGRCRCASGACSTRWLTASSSFGRKISSPRTRTGSSTRLAPFLAMFPSLVALAVVPFGDSICFADNGDKKFGSEDLGRMMPAVNCAIDCKGHLVNLQIADLNVGILYIFAITGTGVVGAALAGWASDNKFSPRRPPRGEPDGELRGRDGHEPRRHPPHLRERAAPRTSVEWQGNNAWGVFVQPFGFLLFLAALAAETKRVPFDQPEGESEIVAGYFVEYSGMKFGMFYLGEYAELITSSAIPMTLFFGGYQLPFVHSDGLTIAFGAHTLFDYKMTHLSLTILSVLAFFGKTVFVAFVQIFFRWTLPRFRYDQLTKLGWTRLLPLSIANLVVTGIIVLCDRRRAAGRAGRAEIRGRRRRGSPGARDAGGGDRG